jgi:hypothetical protein
MTSLRCQVEGASQLVCPLVRLPVGPPVRSFVGSFARLLVGFRVRGVNATPATMLTTETAATESALFMTE